MPADNVAFTGFIPEKYDVYLGPLLFEPYALDIVDRVKGLPHQSILELACGTGRVTTHLSRAFPTSVIVASDLQEDMINYASQKLSLANVSWQKADAQELPFDDNRFDLVICQFGFMFMPDKPKAFAEAFRVLKTGGYLLFNTWDKIENVGPAHVSRQVVNSFFDGNPPVFYNTPFSMFDVEAIKQLMKDAGFVDASVTNVIKPGTSLSAGHATVGFIEGNPIYMEIIKKDPDSIPEIKRSVTEKMIAQFGDNPMQCTLSAFVGMGKKNG